MRARSSITLSYGLTGGLNALWGAALPSTDARLDLGAGRLGGLLTALAVGALAAMPLAGRLADRWTAQRIVRLLLPAAAIAVTGPAAAPTFALLTVATVVLGALFGALNVTLSLQAVAVERAAGRPIMSTVHGVWTLGAVAGGLAISGGLHAGADVGLLVSGGALALATVGVVSGRAAETPRGDREPPAAGPPLGPAAGPPPDPARPGVVILLGVIGAASFVAEGAAVDWAGVHGTRVLGADPATASLAYTVFFVAMTAVRLAGDAVRARLGAAITVRSAGCAATAGYGLVLLAGVLPDAAAAGRIGCAFAGWALVGAGIATVWPIVTSALGAARRASGRISTVTMISYGGGLVGPVLIGALSTAVGLPAALLLPAVLTLAVAAVGPAVLGALALETPSVTPS